MRHHVYPWWLGFFLLSPLRYRSEPPEGLVAPYVHKGMRVLDVGCGMGFFSLPLARLVGDSGTVYCVDLQKRMLSFLQQRARRAGLQGRIVTIACTEDSLGLGTLEGESDFVLACGIVHEVPDAKRLLAEIKSVMKPGARLLVAEPKHVVQPEQFDETLSVAAKVGLRLDERAETRARWIACLTHDECGGDAPHEDASDD